MRVTDGSFSGTSTVTATVAAVDPDWLEWRTREKTPASAVSVPVQAVYNDLVKERLSPAFRRLGFTGSGGRYSLKSDSCWALLGLQKSAYSDAREVQFTANLLVVARAAWSAMRAERTYLPERPSPSTKYGPPAAIQRIGRLLPDPADLWWRLTTDSDISAVAEDALNKVRDYGLPWLQQQMRLQDCY